MGSPSACRDGTNCPGPHGRTSAAVAAVSAPRARCSRAAATQLPLCDRRRSGPQWPGSRRTPPRVARRPRPSSRCRQAGSRSAGSRRRSCSTRAPTTARLRARRASRSRSTRRSSDARCSCARVRRASRRSRSSCRAGASPSTPPCWTGGWIRGGLAAWATPVRWPSHLWRDRPLRGGSPTRCRRAPTPRVRSRRSHSSRSGGE
mmetsp:Transcript_3629/g.11377  ORF Transcript_3629/g.11377 Transcript_3629/m.11377 type:complete len:204 (+) Transcript_3629:185-796(+)